MNKIIEEVLRSKINTNNQESWEVIDASEKNLNTLINELTQALTLGSVVVSEAELPKKSLLKCTCVGLQSIAWCDKHCSG